MRVQSEQVPVCGRCGEDFDGGPEACWYCMGELCVPCWDAYGQCGHPEVRASDEYGSFLTTASVSRAGMQIVDEVRCPVCGESLEVETTLATEEMEDCPAPMTKAFLEHRLSLAMAKAAIAACKHGDKPPKSEA